MLTGYILSFYCFQPHTFSKLIFGQQNKDERTVIYNFLGEGWGRAYLIEAWSLLTFVAIGLGAYSKWHLFEVEFLFE